MSGEKRNSGRVVPLVSDEEIIVIDREGQRSLAKMLDLSDSGTLVYMMDDEDIGGDAGDNCVLSLYHHDKVFNALAAIVRKSGRLVAFRFVLLDDDAASELQTKLIRMEVAWTRMKSRL